MPRLTRVLFAIVLVASAAFARADALRLLAPADGAALRGGSRAELRWSAAELPPAAEEWEAFLSVDGGRYYGWISRLDIDLRSFTFGVPNVAQDGCRILIRHGEERNGVDLGCSFSIVREPDAARSPPTAGSDAGEALAKATGGDIWADAPGGAGLTHRPPCRTRPRRRGMRSSTESRAVAERRRLRHVRCSPEAERPGRAGRAKEE